jgi:hypothetical protein
MRAKKGLLQPFPTTMPATDHRRLLPIFGFLSLLSAFLLFQVQPLISKFILPWFGGSPGVWTTCMLFFQVVLFGGYAYAHFLTRLPHRWQGVIHACLIVAALAFLPITPNEAWKPLGDEDPAGRILALLLATVGLPYFVLSSTGPLVQVWFTRASNGGSPWRLYALSNAGSLAALLSYPFFFEVRWDVTGQTWLWSGAFLVFAALSAAIAWRDRSTQVEVRSSDVAGDLEAKPVSWTRRTLWVFLPALASVLLLATTNHVCQDVAVIPFLWVVPLSLYLVTFIICFEHERWYRPLFWAALAMGFVFVAAVYGGLDWSSGSVVPMPFGWDLKMPWTIEITYKKELFICFGAMFFAVMVCHGELTRLKPDPRHLTEFYLLMSAGGALGGLLVSLVAPRVFDSYREWPWGLMVAFGVAAMVMVREVRGLKTVWLRWGLTAAGFAMLIAGPSLMQKWGPEDDERLERVRNFYGVVSVAEDYDYDYDMPWRSLYHGGIMHGMQNMGDSLKEEPLSYYGEHTGVGRALALAKAKPDARVGVVGMGTGTALCYGSKGHVWRFYEINPVVDRLAKSYFTYMDDFKKRGGQLEVVIGDGRLALEKEESQQFDVLLLDAFSGDSVPMHLLTREAFQIYDRHLKPDGIIAVNCTNRYIALASVIYRIADDLGFGKTRIGTDLEGDHEITDYVLLTRNEAFLKANPPESVFDEVLLDVPVWTDRRHNLFEILEKE